LSDGSSLRARALALLARRDHARAELARKLAAHCTEADDLDALLDELERAGWLSDRRVAESTARRSAGRHGPLRIARALQQRGVDPDAVDAVVRAARDTEFEQARLALRRRFPDPPVDAADRARQGRFLQARGFGLGVIHRVLKAAADPSDAD
jgi:regulatory protein